MCFSAGQAPMFDQAQGGAAALGDLGGLSAHRTLVRLDPGAVSSEGMDELVGDVDALRVHLGLDRMAVLTHLGSAMLSLFWAAARPERVDRLVIVAPFVMVYEETDDVSDAETNASRRIADGDGTPEDWEFFTALLRRIVTSRAPQLVELRAGLATVTAPVPVLTGEQDMPEMAIMADAVASLVPNAQRVLLPNTERFPWRADPDAFRETVESFLSA